MNKFSLWEQDNGTTCNVTTGHFIRMMQDYMQPIETPAPVFGHTFSKVRYSLCNAYVDTMFM